MVAHAPRSSARRPNPGRLDFIAERLCEQRTLKDCRRAIEAISASDCGWRAQPSQSGNHARAIAKHERRRDRDIASAYNHVPSSLNDADAAKRLRQSNGSHSASFR
jgi:hypothetical protein